MKLLFLTPQLPYPPHQGTTLRNFNIIKQLAPRHELHLLSFGMAQELADSPLVQLCARIEIAPPPTRSTTQRAFETFTHPLPDMARRLHSPALSDKLATLLRENQYDVIQIEGIEMANAWLSRRNAHATNRDALYRTNPPISNLLPPISIFDDHNAEWTLQKTAYETDRHNSKRLHGALYSWIQYNKLRSFERAVCLASNAVVAVSEPDARAIAELDTRIKPVVIPNGVDCDYYVPSEGVCAKPLAELSIVFTGKMDFRPNIDAAVWFADEILPLVRNQIPLAHVSFVGQKPSPAVAALGARQGIEVTGFVPDTRPYIADAAVYAVPLRMGSGTRLKVLEAMAMGKAIVSTSFGVSGIEYVDGQDVVIADAAEAFAAAIVSLIRDPERARDLGRNARQLAATKYDWRTLVPNFETLYAAR